MTKLLSAAALLALVAGAAAADPTFSVDRARSTETTLELTNVQADEAGRIQVWALTDGRATALIGNVAVAAGATGNVTVPLNAPARDDLQIVLTNNNRSVATLDVRDALTN